MPAESKVDWEAVYRDYRPNILTLAEIGARHGTSEANIRKKAKKEGWARDMAPAIRRAAAKKLLENPGLDGAVSADGAVMVRLNRTDEEIIEESAMTVAEVVRHHRRSIRNATGIAGLLMEQLVVAVQERQVIEDEIHLETAGDRNPARQNLMLRAVSLPTHAGTLKDLTATLKTLVSMEREAFNIDSEPKEVEENQLEKLMREIDGQTAGLPSKNALASGSEPSENPDQNRIETQA